MNPPSYSFVARGRRVVLPDGERAAAIHIRDGVIAAITGFDEVRPGVDVIEAGDAVVLAGLVDTHVHINEPGRTDWEGFSTATQAAAAGGITTLIEMPLNSIPATTTAAAYRQKTDSAEGKLSVDVGFWGGVVPGNVAELAPLWEAGAFGFKCFLVSSGVDEFKSVNETDLRAALPELARLDAPLLVHAELPNPIEAAMQSAKFRQASAGGGAKKYATWLASRPRAAENEAIALLIHLSGEFGAPVHIVHLSSSDSVALIQKAKQRGARVTVETCPHYLTFAAGEISDAATEFKCAPPIRERENREQLWAALGDGTIDLVATDHSPCPPSMKLQHEGDFLRAWGGIASLQLSLPGVWTEARRRGYALSDIARWMCSAPAKLARIEKRKGSIAVGCDADFIFFNPDAQWRVAPERLYHRHKMTPYAGRELTGAIEATFLRGRKIFDHGEFSDAAAGRVLRRGHL